MLERKTASRRDLGLILACALAAPAYSSAQTLESAHKDIADIVAQGGQIIRQSANDLAIASYVADGCVSTFRLAGRTAPDPGAALTVIDWSKVSQVSEDNSYSDTEIYVQGDIRLAGATVGQADFHMKSDASADGMAKAMEVLRTRCVKP
jgi:hypothetical protein